MYDRIVQLWNHFKSQPKTVSYYGLVLIYRLCIVEDLEELTAYLYVWYSLITCACAQSIMLGQLSPTSNILMTSARTSLTFLEGETVEWVVYNKK